MTAAAPLSVDKLSRAELLELVKFCCAPTRADIARALYVHRINVASEKGDIWKAKVDKMAELSKADPDEPHRRSDRLRQRQGLIAVEIEAAVAWEAYERASRAADRAYVVLKATIHD